MNSDPSVTILNVGHGNSAVIRDGSVTIVVDTGGEQVGARLLDYLKAEGIVEIDALLLSHADEDHIGSAPTLLLSNQVGIKKVFLNSDSTKRTAALRNLQLALAKARREKGTQVETSLTTQQTGLMPKMRCDILYPPPESVVTGPGGRRVDGVAQTTNSLSAVVRVWNEGKRCLILPGDSGADVLAFWEVEGTDPKADVVVFPHHGGRPGPSDPGRFAYLFATATSPEVVVFSMSKTKHDLPREDIVEAILAARPSAQLICTQLPERLESKASQHPWAHHGAGRGTITQLHVRVWMSTGEVSVIQVFDV